MKYAICNEPFEDKSLEEVCRIVSDLGYEGLELAPYTFAEDVRELDSAARKQIRNTVEHAGLEVVGLHWLLISPKGFHLTTEDSGVREKTLDFLKSLMEFCRDVGGKVLIHGSPAQRSITDDQDWAEVEARTLSAFKRLGEHAEKCGVIHCIEPLDIGQTNFIRTPVQALEWVDRTDRPGFQTMIDARACFEEGLEPGEEFRNCRRGVSHVHVNETNMLGPGMGTHDFEPLIRSLHDCAYNGFVTVEPFDYSPGAEHIAQESLSYLQSLEQNF